MVIFPSSHDGLRDESEAEGWIAVVHVKGSTRQWREGAGQVVSKCSIVIGCDIYRCLEQHEPAQAPATHHAPGTEIIGQTMVGNS